MCVVFSLSRDSLHLKRCDQKRKWKKNLSHLHGNIRTIFRISWRDIWMKHQSISKWSYVSSIALNSMSIKNFRIKVVIVLESHKENKKNPLSNAVHMANICVWLCHSCFYWKCDCDWRLCECFFCCCFDLVFNTQSLSIIFTGLEMALELKYAY